jgi:hypothetical protein
MLKTSNNFCNRESARLEKVWEAEGSFITPS